MKTWTPQHVESVWKFPSGTVSIFTPKWLLCACDFSLQVCFVPEVDTAWQNTLLLSVESGLQHWGITHLCCPDPGHEVRKASPQSDQCSHVAAPFCQLCVYQGAYYDSGGFFFFQMKMNVSRTTEAAANSVLTWRTPTAASVGSGAHWEVMGKPVKVRLQLSQSVGNDINHSPSFAVLVLSWLLAAGIKCHSYHFCACQWGCYWNILLIKRRGVSSLFSLPCSFLLGFACI